MTLKNKLRGGVKPYQIALISNKHIRNASISNVGLKNDELSPISGYEPNYEPKRWNNNQKIKDTHNCYSYALNALVASRINKPQPGYSSKYPHISNGNYTCNPFIKRLRKDIPSLYDSTFRGKCKKGFYKIYMAVTENSPDTDYHFYRQDSNGYWSHKPGRTDITNIDASNNKIINPDKANRTYPHYNYDSGCGFFCINTKMSTSVST
jgi:hypothetical protein